MPVQIPDRLETIVEARDALLAYATTLPNPPGLFLGFDRPIRVPFEAARKIIANLDRHGGLGPVVRAQPDDGTSYLVGRKALPPGRNDLPLRVPGPSTIDPVADLAETTAAAGIVHALAARCEMVAAANRGGRNRQAAQVRTEAASLAALGHELVDLIPLFGELFLDQWAREGTARGDTPPPPATNPVNLR